MRLIFFFLLFSVTLSAQRITTLQADRLRLNQKELNEVDIDSITNSATSIATGKAVTSSDQYVRVVDDSLIVHYVGETAIDTVVLRAGVPATSVLDTPFTYLRTMDIGETYSNLVSTTDWINWHRFTAPTLSLVFSPTTTVYEVGTVNSIDLNVTTTNLASATLIDGDIVQTSPSVDSIATWSGTSGTTNISFTPQKDSTGQYKEFSYSFRAYQDYTGVESGKATSNTRTVQAVYPVFYGFVYGTDSTSVFADVYGTLTKLVQTEGNKTVIFNTPDGITPGLVYYAIPQSWSDSDLSQILDHNDFNATPSFTKKAITITSTGLNTNYTSVPYYIYYLNTGVSIFNNNDYEFNR